MFIVTTHNEFDSVADFDAWSSGNAWLEAFKQHPACIDCIDAELEAWSDGHELSAMDINDYLWFDAAASLEEAGLYNSETGLFYDEDGFEEKNDEW